MSKFTTPAILEMPDHYLSDENCDVISTSAGFVTDLPVYRASSGRSCPLTANTPKRHVSEWKRTIMYMAVR